MLAAFDTGMIAVTARHPFFTIEALAVVFLQIFCSVLTSLASSTWVWATPCFGQVRNIESSSLVDLKLKFLTFTRDEFSGHLPRKRSIAILPGAWLRRAWDGTGAMTFTILLTRLLS